MAEVDAAFQELEAEGREHLSHEGVTEDRMSFQRHVDMRYLGQWRAMSIEVGENITSLDEAAASFHEEHGREHNSPVPMHPSRFTDSLSPPPAKRRKQNLLSMIGMVRHQSQILSEM